MKPAASVTQRVGGGAERGFFRLLAAVHRLVVGVEMPVHVDVGVDPAGHHGRIAEVVVDRRRGGIDSRDLVAFDDDARATRHAAAAVDHGAGRDHDAARRLPCRRGGYDNGDNRGTERPHQCVIP